MICQKPLANDFETAQEMVKLCRESSVPLFVHENWRWQRPLREVKKLLNSGVIGKPFRAHVDFSSSFPVFDNQPFLRELEQFILSDMGTHILDVIRFFFGEAEWLISQYAANQPEIRGEDVATVLLQHDRRCDGYVYLKLCQPIGARTVSRSICRYRRRSRIDRACTGFLDSGDRSRKERNRDAVLHEYYSWADPSYALIHSSIVDCHRNLVEGLLGKGNAETTGEDNLRTLQLVFGSYESARLGQPIKFTK